MPGSEKFLYKRTIKSDPKINCLFVFPGIESFAMSSLGYLSIFKELDEMDEIAVERYYSNSKTTATPVKDIDIIVFSSSFELDILQILKILDKLRIPYLASDRDENYPIICAGGPVMTSNPYPYLDFFDFVNIGDSNTTKIFSALSQVPRAQALGELSKIEGVLVGVDARVKKVSNEVGAPVYTCILSENSYFKDTFIIEIGRGCPKMCNFCTASYHNLPVRFAHKEEIFKAIDLGLEYTNKIALLGAYVAGHPDFKEILDYIGSKGGVELSLSSLRADLTDEDVVEALVACGAHTATIAIEAGSETLRKSVNKDLSDEQIETTVRVAREGGLKGLKIYAMIGLPHETQKDLEAIVTLLAKLKKENKGFDLSVSLNTFIPKPNTPFEGAKREDKKSLEKKVAYLKKELHKIGVKLSASSIDWDSVQALISRYPHSLAPYFIDVYKSGGNLGAFKRCWKTFSDIPWEDAVLNPSTKRPWKNISIT